MSNGKILVGYVDEDIREIIVMMLESECDLPVSEFNSGKNAINTLVKEQNFKLIISDIQLNEVGGDQLYLANKDMNNLPFVFITKKDISEIEELSSFNSDNKYNAKLNMPFDHDEFSEIISSALRSTVSEDSNDSETAPKIKNSPYFRMKISRFLKFKKSFSDTFVKISDKKFIKVLNMDENIENEKFKRYLDKGLEFIYMDKAQFNEYLDRRVFVLMQKLEETDLESDEAVSLHLETIQQVQEVAMSVGVKRQIIDLADKLTENVINTIKNNKNFKDFLSPTDGHQLGYQFEHSNLVNYLVCGIANHIGSLTTDQASQKLIQASLFSDIGLTENSHIQIISKSEKVYTDLEPKIRKLIDSHINEGAKAIEISNHPMATDIEKIILNHHEKPDGSGFPRGLDNKNIQQLSAAFILAYDLAHRIIMTGKRSEISINTILLDMGPKYSEGNFAIPYKALKDAIK